MSEWKAGDTCQIKPCRKHATTAKKWRGLWTVAKVRDGEAMVHNGARGVADLDQPGWGASAWLPLGCLLPPGDAPPTRAALLGEEVSRLRAQVAELEATLANERGEGEPPVPGWEWHKKNQEWLHGEPGRRAVVSRTDTGWTWDADHISSPFLDFKTARDAMRAASEQMGVADAS